MTVLVLGVDPGAQRTGYCWKLRETTQSGGVVFPTLDSGVVNPDRLFQWTETWEKWTALPHERFVVACEDFIQRTVDRTERNWTKQSTAKIIGLIRLRTHQLGGVFVLCQPGNLKAGAKIAGIDWSGKSHLEDEKAATCHAAYICHFGLHPANKRRDWLD